ncbi:hypothetical protein CHUAL_010399 [Chamberlinius hualienensis]
MAVFLMNVCKFNGCGITFRSLGDLIQHIEDTHIDFDPRALEKQELQQPPCIPLSYALRFFTDASRKESLDYIKKPKRAHSPAVSICSTTPSGSEFDEEELASESDDSNDSWTTQEEFSSEFILRYGSRIMSNGNPNEDKPFACPVPGCKKRYKNINGIKYHAKNGHRKDARVKKAFRCQCGKSYKTAKGLRSHALIQHSGAASGGGFAETIFGLQTFNNTSSNHFQPTGVTVQPEVSAQLNSLSLPHFSLTNTTPPPTPTSPLTTYTITPPVYSQPTSQANLLSSNSAPTPTTISVQSHLCLTPPPA